MWTSFDKIFTIVMVIVFVVSVALIFIYVKPSPYENDAYCYTCKRVTKQRVVMIGFYPDLECEICHNLNPVPDAPEK